MDEVKTYRFQVLKDMSQQRAMFDWWFAMEERKGERAELRRHQHGGEAMRSLGVFRLMHKLPDLAVSERSIAAVAYLLSYLKVNPEILDKNGSQQGHLEKADDYFKFLLTDQLNLASLLGAESKAGTEKALFSELRFQRLLQASADLDGDEFDKQMRRALQQLQGKTESIINPIVLADHILHRYRAVAKPEWYKGTRQFEYQFAKAYYQQVFTYAKD